MAKKKTTNPDDEDNRLIGRGAADDEQQIELSLRPQYLREYIGQKKVKDNLSIFIKAALARGESLDHVLLNGPPGLGKCITADSWIQTAEGLVKFAELIPAGMEADESRPIQTKICGIDGIEKTSHIYRNGHAATLKLRTRSGFTIEGTQNHPILISTAEGVKWKRLGDLTKGDYVAIARGLNVWNNQSSASAVFSSDKAEERRAKLDHKIRHLYTAFVERVGRPPAVKELSFVFGNASGVISPQPAVSLVTGRLNLPMSQAKKIAQIPEAELAIFSLPETIEEQILLDEDLSYLLGVLVGDGNIEKGVSFPAFVITCEEEEMQRELQRICQKYFNRIPNVHRYENKAAKIRFSQSIGRACLQFGVKAVSASEKCVPDAVLKGSQAIVRGFLQGLFDADGNVWNEGYVEFNTRSELLAKQVQLLLANFGIIAHRRIKQVMDEPFYQMFIGGQDAALFHHLIGFRLPRKYARKDGLNLMKRGWSKSDLIPNANKLLQALLRKTQPHSRAVHKTFDHVKREDRTPSRQQINHYLSLLPESIKEEPEYMLLQTLTDEKYYWDQVDEIMPSANDVYDFVVPQTHSFVANGFFNHNTTLSQIVAREMAAKIHVTAGPVIEKPGDLAAMLTNLEEGDVLFIDEIHRLHPAIEEILYPAMEDFELDLIIGQGPSARSVKLDLPRFTLIGATTRAGLITAPLRGRFGINFHLDFYPIEDLQIIVLRSADILGVEIDDAGAHAIARRARGTPRIANRLLRRVRDFAEVEYEGKITVEVADDALNRMEVDRFGLDEVDRKMLTTIIEKFGGGPVGVSTISAAIQEEKDAIEEIYEPYLIQIGFINRTPRGRVVMPTAYQHLGINLPGAPNLLSDQPGLF